MTQAPFRSGPTTGDIYRNYDHIIRRVEAWIDQQGPHIPGCENDQIKARLVQRIVELSADAYAQRAIDDARAGASSTGQRAMSRITRAGGLAIGVETGKVRVTAGHCIRELARFGLLWLHLLALLAIAIFRKSPRVSLPVTLLMDTPADIDESDERFVRFCRHGPIEPLAVARHVIVQANKAPRLTTDSSFHYAARPLIHLVVNFLQRSLRVRLLVRHLTAPFMYVYACLVCPLTVLLGRDIYVLPVMRWLDAAELVQSVLITTSSFVSQPLWMKGIVNQKSRLHMLWYSQNFIPKMYVGEQTRSDLPSARHMRADVHWVWTEGFASYLKKLGQTSQMRVVGPILWYLPERVSDLGQESIKIALFDVTPLPDGRTSFAAAKNYYSVSTIRSFVADIVAACDKIEASSRREVLILLKHKRAPVSGHHDSTYIGFLDEMAQARPNFRLIEHRTNLFGLLAECDLSISVPYTSTAYVAAHLGKPAIYYDPFAELVAQHEPNELVHFAAGVDELHQLMARCLNISLESRVLKAQ